MIDDHHSSVASGEPIGEPRIRHIGHLNVTSPLTGRLGRRPQQGEG
jgi:hypothetical protein